MEMLTWTVGSIFLKWKGYWVVHRHAGQAIGVIYFDFDDDTIEADNSTGKDASKHVGILH